MSHDPALAGNDADMLDPDEAAEEIPSGSDAAMDSDAEDDSQAQADAAGQHLEIHMRNDSTAHFDAHDGNSIFCIAQHPVHPGIIATGGGNDDEEKEIGIGFIFDCGSSASIPSQPGVERASIPSLAEIKGHTDSISAVSFTQPRGEFLVSGGMDGRLIVTMDSSNGSAKSWRQIAVAQEVDEIIWLSACPCSDPDSDSANTIALGASDGSVWIYSIAVDAPPEQALNILQTYYIHTASCTAGAWTPDGNILVTVSEDGTLYAWDVWGKGAAAGLASTSSSGTGQALVGLTPQDERFKVEGGLYSVAVAPNGAFAATGGEDGNIRVIGLPRLPADPSRAAQSSTAGVKSGAGAKSKTGGAKQAGSTKATNAAGAGQGQAGALLTSIKAQDGSIETLDFIQATGAGGSAAGSMLLASGSVDGSIVVFDASKNFSVRRNIPPRRGDGTALEGDTDREGEAIVKVEFVRGAGDGWLLTSAGYDGVLRRWDLRGGSVQALVGEWRGHQGGGDGGGIMGFVQGLEKGSKVVTAGDDGVSLVFNMAVATTTA